MRRLTHKNMLDIINGPALLGAGCGGSIFIASLTFSSWLRLTEIIV